MHTPTRGTVVNIENSGVLSKLAPTAKNHEARSRNNTKVIAADTPKSGLDILADTVFYHPSEDKFVLMKGPFGVASGYYNYDLTLADDGLYKLWRDGAGGYYTVELSGGRGLRILVFTCRANGQWDDLSDQC